MTLSLIQWAQVQCVQVENKITQDLKIMNTESKCTPQHLWLHQLLYNSLGRDFDETSHSYLQESHHTLHANVILYASCVNIQQLQVCSCMVMATLHLYHIVLQQVSSDIRCPLSSLCVVADVASLTHFQAGLLSLHWKQF